MIVLFGFLRRRLAIRTRLREQLKLTSQDHLIVFISQNIEDAYQDLMSPEDPGYTEKSVFKSLLDQILALKKEGGCNSFAILIKPPVLVSGKIPGVMSSLNLIWLQWIG